MRLALLAWAMLAVSVLAITVPPAMAQTVAAPADEQMAINYDRHARPTVPVTIGPAGPYEFLIDTGAQRTVLSRQLADTLGLMDRRPVTLIGMASRAATHTVLLADLGFGQSRANVPSAVLVEGQHIGGAAGVLGLDALQDRRVLFDFTRHTMTIATTAELGPSRDYEIVVRARARSGQLIVTDARIDGIRTAVVIDTGAEISIGNQALARRLRARQLQMAELNDINGAVAKGQVHVAARAEIGRLALANVMIVAAESPAFQALDLEERPALFLGMRELRMLQRFAIDFERRRILFDVPTSERERAEVWARFVQP